MLEKDLKRSYKWNKKLQASASCLLYVSLNFFDFEKDIMLINNGTFSSNIVILIRTSNENLKFTCVVL